MAMLDNASENESHRQLSVLNERSSIAWCSVLQRFHGVAVARFIALGTRCSTVTRDVKKPTLAVYYWKQRSGKQECCNGKECG